MHLLGWHAAQHNPSYQSIQECLRLNLVNPAVQLEAAATVGVIVILTVLGIIVQTSIHAGLPAIKSGELPLWTFQVRPCLAYKLRTEPGCCQLQPGYIYALGIKCMLLPVLS